MKRNMQPTNTQGFYFFSKTIFLQLVFMILLQFSPQYGYTNSIEGEKDAWFFKLNAAGVINWKLNHTETGIEITSRSLEGSLQTRPDFYLESSVDILIPDPNFEQALIALGYDTNGFNGNIKKTDADLITSLDVNNKNISSLSGIEQFVNLQYLYCHHNLLTTLDLGNNSKLINLHCGDNSLTTIDVSKYPNLASLHIWQNKLTSLDLSQNLKLEELLCSSNKLTSMNISANSKLRFMNFAGNNLVNLNIANGNNINFSRPGWADYSFDARYNPGLSCIKVDAGIINNIPSDWFKDPSANYNTYCLILNCNDLIAIPDPNFEQALIDLGYDTNGLTGNIKKCDALLIIDLNVNGKTISSLAGIEQFVNLQYLYCHHNLLTTLDLGNNSKLINLHCGDNSITNIDLSKNPNLASLHIWQNKLTSLDISRNPNLEELLCSSNKLAEMNISANSKLKFMNIAGNNLVNLNIANGNNINFSGPAWAGYSFDASSNPRLSCIKVDAGIINNIPSHWFKDASADYNANCPIILVAIPDPRFEQALIDLGYDTDGVINSSISKIDADAITDLNVNGKNISSLAGIEHFESLIYLHCNSNLLTVLNLGNKPNLTHLNCDRNAITSIDVSSCPNLIALNIWNNQLLSLDVSQNLQLEELIMFSNKLTSLDISVNVKLKFMNFSNNKLVYLNIANGNNINFAGPGWAGYSFYATNNPALSCIKVDANIINNIPADWFIDATASYNTNCPVINCNDLIAIPDPNFEQALINLGFDTNGLNGNIKKCDALAITNLNVNSKNISSLAGIEHFTNLQYLYCHNNLLTTLDLGNNLKLIDLHCGDNSLTTIDVSKYPNLASLHIWQNKLTSLDLSQNLNLEELLCSSNKLTSMNISANSKLRFINFADNKLVNLNIANGNNANLVRPVWLDGSFDARYNPSLMCIQVDADIIDNIPSDWFKDATASYNTNCPIINCDDLITIPDPNFEQALIDLGFDTNGKNGNIKKCEALAITGLNVNDKNISSLSGIEHFTALTVLYCNNNLLTTLNLGVKPNLTRLDCGRNALTSIDVSNYPKLISLDIWNNQLLSLDISQNLQLEDLVIFRNNLSSLDISVNSKLKFMNFANNKLVNLNIANGNNINFSKYEWATYSFDARNNPALNCIKVDAGIVNNIPDFWFKDAAASYNSNCPIINCNDVIAIPDPNFEQALIDLGFDTNGKNGNIKKCDALLITGLNVNSKNISSLSGIEHFTALTALYCNNNLLTTLNLGDKPNLTRLDCGRNALTSIDVSNYPKLISLDIWNNQLLSLDISQNLQLEDLVIFRNNLSSLDISVNSKLKFMNFANNKLVNLNIANGNNINFSKYEWANYSFDATNNPGLSCIKVDANMINNIPSDWLKDATASYNTSCPIINCDETFAIPDANFEQALIDLGFDTNGLNGNIKKCDALAITDLYIENKNISSLAGIEHFASLKVLNCNNNLLTVLNLGNKPNLTSLDFGRNALTSIDVSNYPKLIALNSWNNQLTSLNVSNNLLLEELITFGNKLTSLDISINTRLKFMNFSGNNLVNLNIANGNNVNFSGPGWAGYSFRANNNPALSCIKVDAGIVNNIPADWFKDATASYSSYSCESLPIVYVNDNSQTGDAYTTAIGNDSNPGTAALPFATIQYAINRVAAGGMIYVDAGTFATANISINKSVTILGANAVISPNNAVNPLLPNASRNAESIITGSTFTIAANDIKLEGLTLDPGNKSAFVLSNNSTTNNDFGNFSFLKNILRINSTSVQFQLTGKFVTSPAMPVTSGYTFTNNRFEKYDAGNGQTMILSYLKNISINNNSFVVAGATPRTQLTANLGSIGLVDSVSFSNNTVDKSWYNLFSSRIANATISNNKFYNSLWSLNLNNNIAESSNIEIINNYIENNLAGNLSYTRTGGATIGSSSVIKIENNTININAGNAQAMNVSYNSSTILNPSVIIRGNHINHTGDYSLISSSNIYGIRVNGKLTNAIIEKNELSFTGTNPLPPVASPNAQIVYSGILLMTDGGSPGTTPSDAIINIQQNKISGYKQSVSIYDAANSTLSPYIGYGNLPAGATVNINNNSFTGDSISINNGTNSQSVNASCNGYGVTSENDVALKVTGSTVNHIPWLASGTDTDPATGFQPATGTCTGRPNKWYVNDNSLTGDVFTTAFGNNANNGTAASPFATIQYAVDQATEGAEIFVDAGSFTEQITFTKNITIKGAGIGNTIINGPNTALVSPPGFVEKGIIQTGQGLGDVIIEDLTIDGTNSDEVHSILIQGGGRISNCEMRNANNGFFFRDVSGTTRVAIGNNNLIRNISYVGILFAGNGMDATATNNEIDLNGASFGMGFIAGYGGDGNIKSLTATNNSVINFNGFGMSVGSLQTAQINNNSITRLSGTGKFISNIISTNINANCNWYGVSNAQDIIPLIAGNINYSPWLTNGTDSDIPTVGFQPMPGVCNGTLPIISLDAKTNITCFGSNNGTVHISVTGGLAPLVFAWNKNGTAGFSSNEDLNNLAPGTYSLILTDANGSTATASYPITQPDEIVLEEIVGTDVSCPGSSDGAAEVYIKSGGIGTFRYLWNTGSTDDVLLDIPGGLYTVAVTDADGCTASSSVDIMEPPAFDVSFTVTHSNNTNSNNGSATVLVTGGNGNYSFLWSTEETTQTISGLAPGTYSVVITDILSCTVTREVTISVLFDVSLDINNVTCKGGNNGSATVNINGGNSPFTYLWSNGGTDATGVNLTAGNHSVTIKDADENEKIESVTITEPDLLLTASTTGTAAICNGGATGSASVNAIGGTGLYNYLWSNGATTASISNILAGTHSVIVTDANACTATTSFVVSEPALLTATTSGSKTLCFGTATGTASVLASGGTSPYSYLWSNGATTSSVSGLAAGNYTVTVTDANGCSATSSYVVIDPPLLTASTSGTAALCFGTATGTATVLPLGGTSPYSYLWSNGATTSSVSGLAAGNYTVTVTDANGCITNASFVVTQPSAVNPSTAATAISCYGLIDGIITVTGRGGTSPYQFSINGGTIYQTSNLFTGLGAGIYTITVKDANGCTGTVSATIIEPPVLSVVLDNLVSTCSGTALGEVNITAAGGTGRYTFSWTGPGGFTSIREDINRLVPGVYNLQLTDANGCAKTLSATVSELPALGISRNITHVACNAAFTGAIDITPTGRGGSGYSFVWSGANGYRATTEDISGLKAGTYSVIVTSTAGCQGTASFEVTQPVSALVLITISTNITCTANGTITATGSGGTGPYQYKLDNGIYQTSGSFSNLAGSPAGVTYVVWVKDANGCTVSKSVIISDDGLDAYEPNALRGKAAPISLNSAILARIAPTAADEDWYKFSTNAGATATYTLSLTHPSVSNYTFNMYTNKGALVNPIAGTTTSTSKQYSLLGGLVAGTDYTIKVSGALSFVCYQMTISSPAPATVLSRTQNVLESSEVSKLSSMAFPNPHNGSFNLKIASPEEGPATIELFTVSGQKISQKAVFLRKAEDNIVPFNGLRTGTIFYRLQIGKHASVGKIIGMD